MSSFPSDEQFDQCVAENKRTAQAINWKDLQTKVVYRVQPQGTITTKRGADTLLELVNRNNEEVKVWAPSSVMDALYSVPATKKIPYIRSLGVNHKRKVFETAFFPDEQPLKKIKEQIQPRLKQRRRELCKKLNKFPKEDKYARMERKKLEKYAAFAKSMGESSATD